ncbi:FAD-dependent oxidoreductase [Henriciella litoralis]|uniref:FAD-dependent oxidoreductase n=1 Tax=Henriciella litoralis TaxID=568102 RepID=UPI000A0525CD|nr:FAD-dependent oxidoreductase [Henriciella litoralis]
MVESIESQCCIAGGGPAGIMLGYLLARQGVNVTVLEKHGDFLRDFRGDTVHPSTMQVLHELGLLEAFLKHPHQKTERIGLNFNGKPYQMVDFTHLPTEAKFVAFMPQWDFLNFVADEARKMPNFRLMMSTRADKLIGSQGQIMGVRASGPDGEYRIRAPLTVACDGRDSTMRDAARLKLVDKGAPIDVLWFRVPREEGDGDEQSFGYVGPGGFLVTINRGSYWQCAFLIEKGGEAAVREAGIEAFREKVGALAAPLEGRLDAVTSFDDVKLLNVQVSRLLRWWREGFLAIGDAAHAMSPVGGVGINLALQDAIAAARMLGPHLLAGTVTGEALAAVQERREWPAKVTQSAQVFVHEKVLLPAIRGNSPKRPPLMVRTLDKVALLRRLPARAIGLGARPEHWPKDLR